MPGTLKKRPIDEFEIARSLEREFKVPSLQIRAYIRLVTTSLRFEQVAEELDLTQSERRVLAENMIEKGLLIRSSTVPSDYLPLHPRMVLTNIFKMFEKDFVQTLRDRRATVDRVVNLLTPIYEEKQNG